MQPSFSEYQEMNKRLSPGSPVGKDCLLAFLFGGAICAFGEGIVTLATSMGFEQKTASLMASLTVMALAVILTAFHKYDDIAKHAGAGTLVPISGFANSIASPAMEFKSEGFVLGVGVKMFTIAGPVILYGTVASIVYGIIYWITTLF
ncbi:MAG: SpoVA/SpoVAEb family sporulation membrane protein [Clostridia bacterium]|nr:SpoVA/SpoVAEb family sporulation membrane protein [Clostridia bacterium]